MQPFQRSWLPQTNAEAYRVTQKSFALRVVPVSAIPCNLPATITFQHNYQQYTQFDDCIAKYYLLQFFYLHTNHFRCVNTISVFFSLSAIVLERCFATYFLEDYEKKQRPYLGFIIITMVLVIAFICSYTFHRGELSIICFYFVQLLVHEVFQWVVVNSLN